MRTLPITVAADADYPLPGLLTLPDGAGPFPAVLLVHGSGPQDRDEAVGPNRPFRDLAVGLADLGVASLRYDKRTLAHGKRLADALQGRLSVEEEVIRDALCAAALLRAEPLIRPDRVYLLGHSMGGMLAPRIDAEGGAFAGLIFWAGTPRTLDALILEQNEASLAAMPPEQRAAAAPLVQALREQFAALPRMAEEDAQHTHILGNLWAWYFKEILTHPPEEYLRRLTKPVLVLQGDRDAHLSVERDFRRYEALLAAHPDAAFHLYPGLNHLLMPSPTGAIAEVLHEYQQPQAVDSQVIADIARWILAHEGAG